MRKRGGRPPRSHAPGERVPMSFRVTPELKRQMDAAAAATGRSVTAEIELRLEQSFRDDRIEAQLAEILRAVKPASPDEWRRAMGIPVLQ